MDAWHFGPPVTSKEGQSLRAKDRLKSCMKRRNHIFYWEFCFLRWCDRHVIVLLASFSKFPAPFFFRCIDFVTVFGRKDSNGSKILMSFLTFGDKGKLYNESSMAVKLNGRMTI